VPALLGQPTVTLEVEPAQPFANEAALIKVQVGNYQEQCERPTFPELPDCTIEYTGQSSSSGITMLGGGPPQVRRQITFSYTLISRKAGHLTIPAISVVVDGQTLTTKPHRLRVRELPKSPSPGDQESGSPDTGGTDLLLAEITCAQSKLFVGQRAQFTLTIWVKAARYRGSPLRRSNMWRFLTGRLGAFEQAQVRAGSARRQLADGSTGLYYVYELPIEFVVKQPGPPSFSDVAVGLNYPTRFSSDIFGDLRVIDQRTVPRMRPAINVPDVQPLPTEGRPPSFSGAVGQFEISTFATPTNVRVGDPIKLVIDITGELIEALPGPDLTAIPELVDNFRVPTEELAGSVSGNRKRFTQTIRAKHAEVKYIPPIEFAYFDPQSEQYVVTRSEPIPVLVSAVEQLDAADLTAITPETTHEPSNAIETRDGLRGNRPHEGELLATVRPVTLTQTALTTLLPPVGFGFIWGLMRLNRARQDQRGRRRRSALRNAERRIHAAATRDLPPGEFHSAIQAALAGYLADRLNEPPGRFLGPAAVTYLEQRGINRELVARCAELLQRCEQAAYAGNADGDTSLAALARQCVRQLERERL
jgi:hypothetical protein